jgi:hypothetical protein
LLHGKPTEVSLIPFFHEGVSYALFSFGSGGAGPTFSVTKERRVWLFGPMGRLSPPSNPF